MVKKAQARTQLRGMTPAVVTLAAMVVPAMTASHAVEAAQKAAFGLAPATAIGKRALHQKHHNRELKTDVPRPGSLAMCAGVASGSAAEATSRTIRVVTGLGNPGEKYVKTRHNVGFLAVEALTARRRRDPEEVVAAALDKPPAGFSDRWGGMCASWETPRGGSVHVIKPQTYMNRSGRCVWEAIKELGVPLEDTLTVVDDVNLPFGQIRLRAKGSAGGHNGLKDIEAMLGSDAFPRLRIGVGRVPEGSDLVSHVLGEFSDEEWTAMPHLVSRAADVLDLWAGGGDWESVLKLSAKVNSKPLAGEPGKGSSGRAD